MIDLYLGLGSNLGDKEANLRKAIALLDTHFKHIATSSFISTPSWGFEGQDFLNAVSHYQTDMVPEAILLICKQIEQTMGRNEQPQYDSDNKRIYHDRIIDIDILLYGDLHIHTETLTIPHPLMQEREFVMRPLRELFSKND